MSDPIITPWHAHRVEITEEDIDELGHASNICYVQWLQDAAVAHSTAAGLGYEGYVRLGGVFVVRRQELDYLRPALRGEVLEVRTRVLNVMAAKCQRETEIERVSDRTMLARGLTTWGFVDVTQGRPMRIPDAVYIAFGFEPRRRRVITE